MSASPADRTPGKTPNGTGPTLMRRPRPVDPLVRPRDRKRRPAQPAESTLNGIKGAHSRGLENSNQSTPHSNAPPHSTTLPTRAPPGIHESLDTAQSGFSSAPIGPYTDYPLVLTKRALKEEMRLHVARFASKKTIDPRDESEFTRPVRLHRRDQRAPPAGGGARDEDVNMDPKDELMDSKEKELREMLRAEREAQREAEMALVAPMANTGGQKRLGSKLKKTQQVFLNNQTEAQKAATKLRYEETLPWHLEDFDNKHTWVGTYEAALSENNVMMVQGKDGAFRVTPIDRWYKFTSKAPFKILTIEEAENRMGKKMKDPRWFMKDQEVAKAQQEEQKNKRATKGLFVGKILDEHDAKVARVGIKRESAGMDEIDFEEDFADDEENPLFDEDLEESKEAAQRIKQDQLQANFFEFKDEKQYDLAEKLEKREKAAQKLVGKKVRKALIKREKNYVYDSDSADNPYSDESESSDSEVERLKEEERKKEEEKKATADKDKDKLKAPQASSGTSTKGTTTPSGRPGKKRPNSANNSEASGNESSRKKQKTKNPPVGTLQPPPGTSTPNGPPSRPRSPAMPLDSTNDRTTVSQKPSTVRLTNHEKRPRQGAGSGSDVEAGSGGEMSDGTRKRIKLHVKQPGLSGKGTPQARSRAASPDASMTNTATGSRAASPDAPSNPPTLKSPTTPNFGGDLPEAEELRKAIPPEGTTISAILGKYKKVIAGNEGQKKKFIELLKTISRFDKVEKKLFPDTKKEKEKEKA